MKNWSITSWKIALLKIFKTLRRSNSREFLKHGTNLVFISWKQIYKFYLGKFNTEREIKFKLRLIVGGSKYISKILRLLSFGTKWKSLIPWFQNGLTFCHQIKIRQLIAFFVLKFRQFRTFLYKIWKHVFTENVSSRKISEYMIWELNFN